jgi:hypothetical protein
MRRSGLSVTVRRDESTQVHLGLNGLGSDLQIRCEHEHRCALREVGRPLSEEGACLELSQPVGHTRGDRGEVVGLWVRERPAVDPLEIEKSPAPKRSLNTTEATSETW